MSLPGFAHFGTYRMIAVDWPWEHDNFGQAKHGASKAIYDELPVSVAHEMPVGSLAHPDGAVLLLWCTGSQAADGAHREIAGAWGFELRTRLFSWAKIVESCQDCGCPWESHAEPGVVEDFPGRCLECPCRRFYPKIHRGPGSYSMQASEDVWLGVRGEGFSKARAEKDVPEILCAPIPGRKHSRKPERIYARAERLWPLASPRLELFARRRRPDWAAWGKEAPQCDLVFGSEIGTTWPTPKKTSELLAIATDVEAANVCEHGDHPAPEGKRFCSPSCESCEHEDSGDFACAGICGLDRDHEGRP